MDAESADFVVSNDGYEIHVNPQAIGRMPLRLEGVDHVVWARSQEVQSVGDPSITATFFPDHATHHQQIVSALLAAANRQSPNHTGFGGKKVRDNPVWNDPVFRVLTVRALIMFCQHYEFDSAFVMDRWANVLESGDYSAPHAHYESRASVVYFVDLGEPHPNFPMSGSFEFIDPRIPYCCSRIPDRPTRGLMPTLTSGLMLLFPSEFLHHVHPYHGTRARITLAWNVLEGTRPDEPALSMEEQVPGEFRRVT